MTGERRHIEKTSIATLYTSFPILVVTTKGVEETIILNELMNTLYVEGTGNSTFQIKKSGPIAII